VGQAVWLSPLQEALNTTAAGRRSVDTLLRFKLEATRAGSAPASDTQLRRRTYLACNPTESGLPDPISQAVALTAADGPKSYRGLLLFYCVQPAVGGTDVEAAFGEYRRNFDGCIQGKLPQDLSGGPVQGVEDPCLVAEVYAIAQNDW